MALLYDFLPIILFFIVYKLSNIYVATAVAMLASLIQVFLYRIRRHRFEKMQLITLAIITILGSATLLFHNPMFIKWKPTAIYWIFAIAFSVSQFIYKKPLIQSVIGSQISLPEIVWARLNICWILFFSLMGSLNLFFAYRYSTDTWVNFKLFGILGMTVVFMIIQAFYVSRHLSETDLEKLATNKYQK